MMKPEILAPAGNMETLISAINAGANAIYLAGTKYGARASASNFSNSELIKAIHHAHLRGVLIYVTVNTIIYNDEIDDFIKYTDFLVKNRVDALILQDLGMIEFLAKRYPLKDIHVSTQVNIHNVKQAHLVKSLGAKRIVLARETPFEVVKAIKEQVDIELELFVQGALCVSYSGQCLISSLNNKRSGNRGECAQNCRMPYQLTKDGVALTKEAYLLSTKDLMTLDNISKLVDLKINSFKIEGRMRRKEYVIQAIWSYQNAITKHLNNQKEDNKRDILKLSKVFNREFTKGLMFREKPKDINNDFRPNHLGTTLGTVIATSPRKITVQLVDDLHVGDGYRVIGEIDFGEQVSRITKNGQLVNQAYKGDIIILDVPKQLKEKSLVVKTIDSVFEQNFEKYNDTDYKMVPLNGVLTAELGAPLALVLTLGHHEISVFGETILEKATSKSVSKEQIIEQVSKLGNTPYYYEFLTVQTSNDLYISIKELNQLRRDALKKLEQTILDYKTVSICDNPINKKEIPVTSGNNFKVENEMQLQEVLAGHYSSVYFKEPDHNKRIIEVGDRINFISSKAKETSFIHDIGQLYHNGVNHITSEFFNVTNIYTANLLFRLGASKVTLSLELSLERIKVFSDRYYDAFGSYPNLELIVYGNQDVMITKYCPIAKALNTHENCFMCRQHQFELIDYNQNKMSLINDSGCHLRILNYQTLNLLTYLGVFEKCNISNFRVDFTKETPAEVRTITHAIKSDTKLLLNHKYYLGRLFE